MDIINVAFLKKGTLFEAVKGPIPIKDFCAIFLFRPRHRRLKWFLNSLNIYVCALNKKLCHCAGLFSLI